MNVVDVGFARDRTMKHFATVALVLRVLSVGAANRQRANQGPQFQDLFNGKDLTGWVNINTAEDTWKFRDGMLICSGRPIGVMCSEKQYENFVLHIEWMHMEAGGNSGVFVWSDARPDPSATGCPTASRSRCWSSNGRTCTSATA